MPRRSGHNFSDATLNPEVVARCSRAHAAMRIGARLLWQRASGGKELEEDEHVDVRQTMNPIETLGAEAAGCRRCPLHAAASQTVFGEGPAPAPLMLVGEQPGDQEDFAGRPFVGPAGVLLDRALRDAGLDRRAIYVTNAVKHFKFLQRGKRRLHQKPTVPEIRACLSWLEREMAVVRPQAAMALGATAARALTGRDLKIGAVRGSRLRLDNGVDLRVTVHPSYLLRLQNEAVRAREYDAFVADLRQVAALAPLHHP